MIPNNKPLGRETNGFEEYDDSNDIRELQEMEQNLAREAEMGDSSSA